MNNLSKYIVEKLKLNKDIKTDNYISGEDMFSFIQRYILNQIQLPNTHNVSTFESFLTSLKDNQFNILCTKQCKQIWGTTKNYDFIDYQEDADITYIDNEYCSNNDNLYFGGGIYAWFSEKRDKVSIHIENNEYNNFDHKYDPIIICRK